VNKQGKDVFYPLIGDKVCLSGNNKIWEVWWALYSTRYGGVFQLVPWPSKSLNRMIEARAPDLVPAPPEAIVLDELALVLGEDAPLR
jgi:hypothetical protein